MRVVMLTTGGEYGRWIADGLAQRGVRIDAIVFDAYRPRARVALRKPRRLVGPFRRWLGARALRRHAPLRVVGNLNDQRSTQMLQSLQPGLLVLGGARILSPHVLSTASWGALNAHPARLPGFRGTGVVSWSILRGVPVTVTVHVVASEVDAGDILEMRLVPIQPGDTLDDIQHRADRMCAVALAEVTAAIVRGEPIARKPQNAEAEILRWPDPEQRRHAEELVEAGEALRLYRQAADE